MADNNTGQAHLELKTITMWECHDCYVLLPYPKAPHGCPVPDCEDLGYFEEQDFLQCIYEWVDRTRKTDKVRVVIIYGPNPTDY